MINWHLPKQTFLNEFHCNCFSEVQKESDAPNSIHGVEWLLGVPDVQSCIHPAIELVSCLLQCVLWSHDYLTAGPVVPKQWSMDPHLMTASLQTTAANGVDSWTDSLEMPVNIKHKRARFCKYHIIFNIRHISHIFFQVEIVQWF
jgi:hypothetical protein